MEPEIEGRFENVEFRLTEAEEKIVSQDATLSAIKQLILRGMRLLAENQEGMKELKEGMKELHEAQKALTNAQIATEDSLRRWLDRQNNGHS